MSAITRAQIREVLDLHRRQLFGLIEVRGVGTLKGLYADARAELQDKLAHLVRQGRGATFSAHHLRLVLAQVGPAVKQVEGDIRGTLEKVGKTGTQLAPRHVLDAAEKLHAGFGSPTPLVRPDQVGVFQGAYPGVWPSLVEKFETSSKLYGPQTIAAVKDQLSMALVQKEGLDQAVDRVSGTSGIFSGQRWRAERIVRTELSWSYGVAKQRGMETLKDRFVPDLMKRLVATHDSRTGADSEELDGQTVEVSAPFVWHVKNRAGAVLRTVLYQQPPNRPNDREVVVPWRRGWPSPGKLGDVAASTRGLPPAG